MEIPLVQNKFLFIYSSWSLLGIPEYVDYCLSSVTKILSHCYFECWFSLFPLSPSRTNSVRTDGNFSLYQYISQYSIAFYSLDHFCSWATFFEIPPDLFSRSELKFCPLCHLTFHIFPGYFIIIFKIQ